MSNNAQQDSQPTTELGARAETDSRIAVESRVSVGRVWLLLLIVKVRHLLLFLWSRLQRTSHTTKSSTFDGSREILLDTARAADRLVHSISRAVDCDVNNSSLAHRGIDSTRRTQPLFPHRQFKTSIYNNRSSSTTTQIRPQWLPRVKRPNKCRAFKPRRRNRDRPSKGGSPMILV